MASSFRRTDVVATLAARFADSPELVGCPVYTAPPRSDVRPPRFIWLAAGDGIVVIPTMKAGRKVRDDTFQVDAWCLAYGDGDPDGTATSVAAESLGQAIDNVLADDPHLKLEGIDYVISVTVSDANGPRPIPTEIGYEAAFHLVLEAKVRMT